MIWLQHMYILKMVFSHSVKKVNTCTTYDSRPINKLQNGITVLIFQMWKIRNIDFVRNLIVTEIFMKMTSLLWCHVYTEHSQSVQYFAHSPLAKC